MSSRESPFCGYTRGNLFYLFKIVLPLREVKNWHYFYKPNFIDLKCFETEKKKFFDKKRTLSGLTHGGQPGTDNVRGLDAFAKIILALCRVFF
jgi:hypothetical protein